MAQVFSSDLLKFALVILVATLLDSCFSAPTTPAAEPWWYNPCTSSLQPKQRHGRSTTNGKQILKNQLNYFIGVLNKDMKKIKQLYHITSNKARSTPISKLPWLKMNKMIKKIQSSNNKSEIEGLPQFHESLQLIAGTMDVLRKAQISSTTDNTFDQDKRNAIYEEITNEMKRLLCEVQTIILVTKSETSLKKIPLSKKIPNAVKKNLSVTSAQMVDISFFNKTRIFFKKAQRILSKSKSKSKSKKAPSAGKKRKTKS